MFRMHGSMQTLAPPPKDIVALRMSRIDILERLIVFAQQALAAVMQRLDIKAFLRIDRWMRIALSLQFHIQDGALDAPRAPRKARTRDGAESDSERPEQLFDRERFFERERDDDDASVQAYLDRPFGEVVALICKGIGMTPDWDAWACEPWAQEEIAAQPPGSPYAGYASDPPPPSLEPPEPRAAPPPDVAKLAAPPGAPAPPPDRKTRRA